MPKRCVWTAVLLSLLVLWGLPMPAFGQSMSMTSRSLHVPAGQTVALALEAQGELVLTLAPLAGGRVEAADLSVTGPQGQILCARSADEASVDGTLRCELRLMEPTRLEVRVRNRRGPPDYRMTVALRSAPGQTSTYLSLGTL